MTGPTGPDGFSILLTSEGVNQLLASRAKVSVSVCIIGKVSFVKLTRALAFEV